MNIFKKFLRIKDSNLDERELLIRGNIFKHGWMWTLALLIINAIVCDILEHRIFAGIWDSLVILSFAVAFTNIEMIYYQIYPMSKAVNRRLFIFIGVVGLVFIGAGLYCTLIEAIPLVYHDVISVPVAMIIVGISYCAIYIAYKIREFYKVEEE